MKETRHIALLSVAASLITLALKFGAYFFTDSVSLFSDAAESLVNLTASLAAFGALTLASQPPDDTHAYGHDKAEYFSAGLEGGLVLVAAISIMYMAVTRFLHPVPLSDLWIGMPLALAAAGVNYGIAVVMLRAAQTHDSITLEADARHLLTDVWTTAGVLAGLLMVALAPPGWEILDPLLAAAVGLHIVGTGVGLMRRSWQGLMDASLPIPERGEIQAAILGELPREASFHDLRTRKSGSRRFIEFHLLVPGAWSVDEAHGLCDRIEAAIGARLAKTSVTIHVEPAESDTLEL